MIVILKPADYDQWLTFSPDEAKAFLQLWGGELEAHAKVAAERKIQSALAIQENKTPANWGMRATEDKWPKN